MSYQHFYSRVPARVSLYNKRDGFDTFAQSAALNPEFVRGELSCVYADKLGIHSPLRIRRGEIPTVYSQYYFESGVVAQTAIGYLPADFTGERSAYIAHSLILNDSERDKVFKNPNADIFNPDMFITDISRFSLTATNAVANTACHELDYIPRAVGKHKELVSEYNSDMLKSFIFAVISAVVGDGREVFFRLPGEDKDASERAVRFINAIASLLPYSVRERLSFVSYISSPTAYPGFKVKCVDSSVVVIPPELGVFYDFTTGIVTGQTINYERNQVFATFFHSFYDYPSIKDAFHRFFEDVISSCEDVTIDLKMVKELSFLFWQCSGFYLESSVLPTDESISGLFDVYEKYRDGLTTEQRVQTYRCLNRYAEEQIAIPDNVFSRLSTLYPTECAEAKAVALDVLLKIIHVDLMRDTIFCFISRNYPGELESVRALIMSNLASVFYGGFLQQSILAFFDAHFATEPVQTRDIILDKLLLSIRTPEIQRQIVIVLDRHYSSLNSAQKLKVCGTCLEMIPERDVLSSLLVDLVNRRVGREGGDVAALMDSKLTEALYINLMSGEPILAAMFIENPGFCEDLVLKYAISGGQRSEVIIGMLAAMPAHKRAAKLIRAYKVAKKISKEHYLAFIGVFAKTNVNIAPSTLDEILRQDKLANITLDKDIVAPFREAVIYPAVARTLYQVFKPSYGDGLEMLKKYAEDNPRLLNSAEYNSLLEYHKLVQKCSIGDVDGAFKIAEKLPDNQEIRSDVAEYIKAREYNPDLQDAETASSYELIIDYLSLGRFDFFKMYERYQEYYEDYYIEEGGFIGGIKADLRGAASAIELVIASSSAICEVSDELESLVLDDECGLRKALSEFISFFGPGAGVLLKKKLADAYFEIEEIAEELIEERNSNISSVSDAVDFLFRRK